MGKLTLEHLKKHIKKSFTETKEFGMASGVAKDMAKLGIDGSGYESNLLEEKVLWPLERAWDWIRDIPRKIKFFIQRGKRGYSDRDVWNLHHYLSDVIAGSVRQLRDTTMSYPMGTTSNEWSKTLTKMANGFEAGEKSLDLSYQKRKRERLTKEFVKALTLFCTRFFDLWD